MADEKFYNEITGQPVIIKCSNENKDELLSYLFREPTEHCFMIGDTENFSFEEDYIDAWIVKKKERITSVLMRYYKFYTLSAVDYESLREISNKILPGADWLLISGLEDLVKNISNRIEMGEIKKMYLAELNKDTFIDYQTDLVPQKATVNDLDELFSFYLGIKELGMTEEGREVFGQDVITNTGCIFFLKQGTRIVSAANITAVNSINGTVIGVATDKIYRNKGYARACLLNVCREILLDGKTIVLFYDTPDAGKLYKSIGFVDVNRWAITKKSSV